MFCVQTRLSNMSHPSVLYFKASTDSLVGLTQTNIVGDKYKVMGTLRTYKELKEAATKQTHA